MFFPISNSHISPVYLVVVGFIIGILGGFFGVGGSFIAGPALRAVGLVSTTKSLKDSFGLRRPEPPTSLRWRAIHVHPYWESAPTEMPRSARAFPATKADTSIGLATAK
jgi:hypothetical protein